MLDILRQLEEHPGSNEKINILTKNKDNELLKKLLVAALNPYIQYYIRKIPAVERSTISLTLEEFLVGLNKLSSREITGHAVIDYLSNMLGMLSPEDEIVATRVVLKDLRCGVQESTVNKVWHKLIPTYPCLLAQPGDEKHLSKVVYPAASQQKSDGIRINFICNRGEVVSRGRSGKELKFHNTLDHIFVEMEKVYGQPCVFDGELIVEDVNGNVMQRAIGNGILNKAIKGTISESEARMIRVQIWDVIQYNDFFNGKCDQLYSTRKKLLDDIFAVMEKDFGEMLNDSSRAKIPLVSNMETVVVNNFEEAREHFLAMRAQGFEGTIIKNWKGCWRDHRSPDMVKMKAEEEADLEVIGWNKGAIGTKLENKMGSLICASSDRKIIVSISGFPDALRDEITENIDAWIGRIVTVRYNERIKSKTLKEESLFLPRFVCLREDKDIANSSDEII